MSTSEASSANEHPAPYGGAAEPQTSVTNPVAGISVTKRVRIPHLLARKASGQPWSMLTTYDMLTAQIFDEAGVEVLLVGDSAGNNVLGYQTTLPVTVDELIPLTRAVAQAAIRAFVLADLPFGSYQASPQQAFATAARFMKEGLAHGVKLEGGAAMAPTVKLLTSGGIPVCGHLGFTPQSEHTLGGYRVQGRGETSQVLLADAQALQEAGAFAIVLEMVPTAVAAQLTAALQIPTVGIGAGPQCDAQVLVWQDMAGLRGGKIPRFVKQYAHLRADLLAATQAYIADVAAGTFPDAAHSFES